MLVLRRKIDETVVIGDEIRVTVLAVEGDTVKLGFTAPREIDVMREELYESLRHENIRAGTQNVAGNTLKHLLNKAVQHKK